MEYVSDFGSPVDHMFSSHADAESPSVVKGSCETCPAHKAKLVGGMARCSDYCCTCQKLYEECTCDEEDEEEEEEEEEEDEEDEDEEEEEESPGVVSVAEQQLKTGNILELEGSIPFWGWSNNFLSHLDKEWNLIARLFGYTGWGTFTDGRKESYGLSGYSPAGPKEKVIQWWEEQVFQPLGIKARPKDWSQPPTEKLPATADGLPRDKLKDYVFEIMCDHYSFRTKDELILRSDDGSHSPSFTKLVNRGETYIPTREWHYTDLSRLKPLRRL